VRVKFNKHGRWVPDADAETVINTAGNGVNVYYL
jgi:hypothetical protein